MRRLARTVLCSLAAFAPALAHAQPQVSPTTVKVTAPDGTALKATYFSPGRPGPGLMLLHQCNRDRASWTELATQAAARGYHVLAMDYRGYGDSEGQRFDNFQEQQPVMAEKWPGDIDAAYAWLLAQKGVDADRIGAAGASCGVNQSLLLARRHPAVKTVVLLSGNASTGAREYLRDTPGLPVFAAASLDDGGAVGSMKWILGWSRNKNNRFVEYKAAGHGTDMFAVEKGLQPLILEWLDARLRGAPSTLPKPEAPLTPTKVEKFWTLLTRPGGIEAARKMYADVKRSDPELLLFPESEVNQHGYALLQAGNTGDAIAVFQLNVEAYPQSANTYDSLADGYLAAGKHDDALRYAEKALAMLATDKNSSPEFKEAIRESAEKKVKELKKK